LRNSRRRPGGRHCRTLELVSVTVVVGKGPNPDRHPVLHKLSEFIQACLEEAIKAPRLADESPDPNRRRALLELERSWRNLAQSQDSTERLGRFIRAADRGSVSTGSPTDGAKGRCGSTTPEEPLICVIDDDETARAGMADLIQSLGFSPATFASAEEFLLSDSVRDAKCLISDVQMPGMSGLDLQAQLTAGGCRIPIIFVTGYPDEATGTRALACGALGFLSKPCSEKSLIDYLETALAKAAAK
jgi:CheY-like chemotaxis protein